MDFLPVVIAIVGALGVLFLLIMKLKLHAFVALLGVSIVLALAVGINPLEVGEVVEEGMGGVLGFVAIVVGLGAMFGEVLKVSGAARRIADTLVSAFGEKRVPWSLGFAGFIVAIPVFFDVGLVLLMPLVYRLVRQLKVALIVLALPLLAGLSAAHSFVPPTPGPVAAAGVLGADLGWVILFGVGAGIPAVIVAGVLYGQLVGRRITVGVPDSMGSGDDDEVDREPPPFWLVLAILLVPLVLILGNTFTEALVDEGTVFAQVMAVAGNPFVALIVALLLAFYVIGFRQKLDREALRSVATKALEPVGMILLVTGAGGVFGAVLEESGIDEGIEQLFEATGMPIILLGFLAAVAFRTALGSGTVAMVTASAIVAQVVADQDVSAPLLGAIVVAIGAGATVLSHVNDSGFWLVNRYLGIDEKQTLVAWTGMQTILGGVAFAIVLGASFFLT